MAYGWIRARPRISRRSVLRGIGGGVATASFLGGCSDELAGPGADARAVDAAADSAADVGIDAGVDLPEDAGVDAATDLAAAPDLAPDVAPDLAPDLAADVRRPGILSVPPDDLDVTARSLTYRTDREVEAYLAVPDQVGTFAGWC